MLKCNVHVNTRDSYDDRHIITNLCRKPVLNNIQVHIDYNNNAINIKIPTLVTPLPPTKKNNPKPRIFEGNEEPNIKSYLFSYFFS